MLLSDREDAYVVVVAAVVVVGVGVVVDADDVVVDAVADFSPSSLNLVYELVHLHHFFDVAFFAFPTIGFVKLFGPH